MKEVIRYILIAFFNVFYRLKITGVENVPAKGAAVLCSNHIGEIDMFLYWDKDQKAYKVYGKKRSFLKPPGCRIHKMAWGFSH
jgi:1-acyl-sn-glycerol-3-phosphate acyltransferase